MQITGIDLVAGSLRNAVDLCIEAARSGDDMKTVREAASKKVGPAAA
jgi:hypothetical protein